jgi:hypothetical protein
MINIAVSAVLPGPVRRARALLATATAEAGLTLDGDGKRR